eukprot:5565550-Alexandrium_andersonii.AAC.1
MELDSTEAPVHAAVAADTNPTERIREAMKLLEGLDGVGDVSKMLAAKLPAKPQPNPKKALDVAVRH